MTRSGFLGLLTAAFQIDPAKPRYASFTDAEIHLIRDFFRPGGGNPTPAAKKKEPLPPAVAKQLRRGGTLPENASVESFPEALAKQLPAPVKDYERVLFHRWALLVQSSTRLIVDLIELAQKQTQPD